jgi:hypothetical protein
MIIESNGFGDNAIATLNTNTMLADNVGIDGFYHVICHDKDGNFKWEEKFDNQVVQAGKILMFTALLQTTTTLVGPFLGLVSGTGNTFSPTDTMASHAGWTEFINYTVGGSAVRGTTSFSTPTGNGSTTPGANIVTATAAAITYTITGVGGTVGGCFVVTGSGAVNTQSSTAGTLYSAGAFATAKVTTAGDTVAVTYNTTATS